MKTENISLIATEPFIQKFVLAIIENIREKNFGHEERHIVHADMVPRVSERVMLASMGEGISRRALVLPKPIMIPPKPVAVLPKPVMIPPKPVAIPPKTIVPAPVPNVVRSPPVPVQVIKSPEVVKPVVVEPAAPVEEAPVAEGQGYNKIKMLLDDPSVSAVECSGAGKPVMITRAARRQPTRIFLSAGEIRDVLDRVSDMAHIPLLEGVFRAAVDGFNINAVISEVVGSRFVIRKG